MLMLDENYIIHLIKILILGKIIIFEQHLKKKVFL